MREERKRRRSEKEPEKGRFQEEAGWVEGGCG